MSTAIKTIIGIVNPEHLPTSSQPPGSRILRGNFISDITDTFTDQTPSKIIDNKLAIKEGKKYFDSFGKYIPDTNLASDIYLMADKISLSLDELFNEHGFNGQKDSELIRYKDSGNEIDHTGILGYSILNRNSSDPSKSHYAAIITLSQVYGHDNLEIVIVEKKRENDPKGYSMFDVYVRNNIEDGVIISEFSGSYVCVNRIVAMQVIPRLIDRLKSNPQLRNLYDLDDKYDFNSLFECSDITQCRVV